MTIQLTEKQKSEGWRIVKFGEIAKSVSKRVDPADTKLEVYVGLEHLDPDNLRITRRGIPSDVKGQKLLVKPGQIIFGKRRAYQRKVAVADFEGICSAHAMVLEAIPEKVLPDYLPFFMQSDMFMERAVAISEGSLSPTIKWKTLANQEFPLPPRTRQEDMLKILYSMENVIKSTECFLQSLNTYQSKILARLFRGQHPVKNRSLDYKNLKLEKIVELAYGKSPQGIKFDDGNISIYGTGGKVGLTNKKLSNGPTIIIGRKGTLDKPIFVEENFWAIDTTYYCINLQDTVMLKWLYYYFCALDLKKYDESSGVPSLARNTLYKISLKIPSLEDQNMYVSINEKLDILRKTQTNHLDNLKILKNKFTVKYLNDEGA